MKNFTNSIGCLIIAFIAALVVANSSIAQEIEQPLVVTKESNVEILDYDAVQNLTEEAFAQDTVYTAQEQTSN